MNRRMFLKGVGGVVVGLPLLESLWPRSARAQTPPPPRFAVFVRQGNGVAQKWNTEVEQFWPSALGPLTKASMEADADRATSELKDYADKLLLVRGTKFNFPGEGCGHSGGGNQVLTAAKVSTDPRGNRSLAMGESVDNRIARELNPAGVEPLTLYAGRKFGYLDEVLSYRGAKDLRGAERNPYTAYQRLVGPAELDAVEQQRLAKRRLSVNDLVRDEMKRLMGRSELSRSDRQRLELHFDSIRDLEVGMAKVLPTDRAEALKSAAAILNDDDKIEAVAKLHMELIAFAFASGYTHAATLQIGSGNDGTRYTVDGVKQPSFHQISHRIFSDGSEGDPIPDAVEKHHKIDRLFARLFKHLLDKLSAYTTPTGTLLDDCAAVWCNDLSNGPPHGYSNLPWVVAGSCGGFLKTGQYIDAGNVAHNRFLSTIISATGVRKSDGALVDDFGDPSLPKGVINAMIKSG